MATLPVCDEHRPDFDSVREYLATSYRPDCDYVDGRIQERDGGEYEHGYLQTLLAHLFMNHQEDWGVRPSTDVRRQVSRTHFRVPDIMVLRAASTSAEGVAAAAIWGFSGLAGEQRTHRAGYAHPGGLERVVRGVGPGVADHRASELLL